MQFNNLSQEQALVHKMVAKNKLSMISYLDIFMLSSTLTQSIQDHLNEGKRILFILEDEKIISTLNSKIQNSRLSPFSIILKDSDFMTDGDISKIRSLYKQKEAKDLNNYQIRNKNLELIKERINHSFSTMGNKVFGDRRWVDICRINSPASRRLNEIYQKIKLSYTPQEFWHLRGKIEDAQSLYNQKNILSDNILKKFRIVLDSPNSIEKLKENLENFKNKLSKITLKLDAEINRYEEKIWDKLHEEYIVLKNISNDIELSLFKDSEFKTESKISFFNNSKSKKDNEHSNITHYFDILKKNILFNQDHELIGLNSKTSIETFIKNLNQNLLNWHEQGEATVLKMMKSLNKHNSDTATLLKIDQELNMLFIELNESNIFADQFENTSMNILNQYGFLSDLLRSVKILLEYIINNRELILWQSFYHQLNPEAKAIIDLLKDHDSSLWLEMFESWYYEKLIQNKSIPDIYNLDVLLDEYQDEVSECQNEFTEYIDNQFFTTRQKLTALFKTRNKKLYNALFKKKGIDNLRYFDLIWEEKEMITHYIPITIINSKLLRSNRLLKDGNWDLIYCDNTNIFNHIEKNTLLIHKICFLSPLSERVKIGNDLELDQNDTEKSIKVLLHEYNYQKPLNELPISEKLKAAKKLAKLLLSLNQGLHLYQLKFANIISLLSSDYNEILNSALDKYGVKESDIGFKLYESVTESILETDRNQYLFIQDYLINLDNSEYFMWQLHVLDLFKKAGFQIINIKSFEKTDKREQIDLIIKQLIPKENKEDIIVSSEA
jgi:hypothetical protein